MSTQYDRHFSRRRFLNGLTLAGAVGLLGVSPRAVAAEPPTETTTLRLFRLPSLCSAPTEVAGDLLVGEGFSEHHALARLNVPVFGAWRQRPPFCRPDWL
jgi:NitT/TauT family transport system substrate-binding protein